MFNFQLKWNSYYSFQWIETQTNGFTFTFSRVQCVCVCVLCELGAFIFLSVQFSTFYKINIPMYKTNIKPWSFTASSTNAKQFSFLYLFPSLSLVAVLCCKVFLIVRVVVSSKNMYISFLHTVFLSNSLFSLPSSPSSSHLFNIWFYFFSYDF